VVRRQLGAPNMLLLLSVRRHSWLDCSSPLRHPYDLFKTSVILAHRAPGYWSTTEILCTLPAISVPYRHAESGRQKKSLRVHYVFAVRFF
jgi:hypothetical protein